MLQLHELESLKDKRKRVGRGGSRGGTSGRGHKGQKARSGSHYRPASFEGGQMPLSRRLPRRGFTNIFKKQFVLIGLKELEAYFDADSIVNKQVLREKGLLKGKKELPVKILSNGTLNKKLTVQVEAFTKSAVAAIEKAGGVVQQIKESGRGSITS